MSIELDKRIFTSTHPGMLTCLQGKRLASSIVSLTIQEIEGPVRWQWASFWIPDEDEWVTCRSDKNMKTHLFPLRLNTIIFFRSNDLIQDEEYLLNPSWNQLWCVPLEPLNKQHHSLLDILKWKKFPNPRREFSLQEKHLNETPHDASRERTEESNNFTRINESVWLVPFLCGKQYPVSSSGPLIFSGPVLSTSSE